MQLNTIVSVVTFLNGSTHENPDSATGAPFLLFCLYENQDAVKSFSNTFAGADEKPWS